MCEPSTGTREEYETLLERHRRFLETTELQASRGYYDLAIFSLKQALQLYLKACLLKHGLTYPRTHSLRTLTELLFSVTGDRCSNRCSETTPWS